jgi:hypothetical protein
MGGWNERIRRRTPMNGTKNLVVLHIDTARQEKTYIEMKTEQSSRLGISFGRRGVSGGYHRKYSPKWTATGLRHW